MDQLIDRVFLRARSQNGWIDEPVSDDTIRRLYDIVKFGPTSANSSPARFIFLRTAAAKGRLRPYLDAGNVHKVMAAPVTAIIGFDTKFYEALPRLLPHNPAARAWFAGQDKQAHAYTTAFRNGSLQGGYLILAARMLGLDCGPMSGFDGGAVDREFWSGTSVQTNFLCALGRGDPAKVFARSPRLSFEDACRLM